MIIVTSATEGHAMVATYGRSRAAYVNYTSVPVIRSSDHCLSFWFYMFPGPVGRLAVYMTRDGSVRQRVWERQVGLGGTGIGGRWLQGEIQLSAHVFPLTEVCIPVHMCIPVHTCPFNNQLTCLQIVRHSHF